MEYIELNNNVKMPILGFGTYFEHAIDTKDAVLCALKEGYRSLDTAKWYVNEQEVEKAIKESQIARKDLFITCKVESKGYQNTINDVYDSLKKFDTDYFDLILIHWPAGDILDTYRALEYLYKNKIARAIGISNFNEQYCEYILNNCKIKPQVNQIETHLYFQAKKMNEYLVNNNIIHESWSPFGEGKINIFSDPAVINIAKKYNKKESQIILRYLIQKNIVVIPRSTNPEHIKENFNVFDFKLDDEDMNTLESLDKKKRVSGWPESMKIEEIY